MHPPFKIQEIIMKLKTTSILALAASSVLLTACGGGGGGNSNVIASSDDPVIISPVDSGNGDPYDLGSLSYAFSREYSGRTEGVSVSPQASVTVYYNDAGVEIAYGIDHTADNVQLSFVGTDYETNDYSEDNTFRVIGTADGSTFVAFANVEEQGLEHMNYGVWEERSEDINTLSHSSAFAGGELATNMPTSGSATFVGHYVGTETTDDFQSLFAYKGDVTFDADFANNKVNNFVATADYVNNLNGDWTPVVTNDYDFSGTDYDVSEGHFNGEITSQRFIAEIDGFFFGENADEAGGIFQGQEIDGTDMWDDVGNRVHGSFGANKQ